MSTLFRRLALWLRHRQVQDDLSEEMEFHRAAHQRALESDGLSPAEARTESLRAMGNVTLAREDARGVWIAPWIESVWQDVAYAVRTLWRQPGFALLAIGALTAGIGLNVSLFTVYTALTMKPWTAREPERLVRVINTSTYDLRKRAGGGPGGFSRAEAEHLAANAKTLSGVTILGRAVSVVTGGADVTAYWVGGNYFTLLGVEMAAGRGFADDEDRLGTPVPVAVVSYGFFQRQLGGDRAAVGRQIRLDGVPFTVVGVASPRFLGTAAERVDIWMPIASSALLRPQDRWARSVGLQAANCCTPIAARLAPDVTTEQARAELEVLSRQFRGERPGDQGVLRLAGTEILQQAKGDASGTFMPLFVGLLLVLLLACANVGNLQLARGAARRREIAVRLSLGASRVRLIRQLLIESFVIACTAGAAGILLAAWLPSRIVALYAGTPVALQLEPDGRVLLFTLALCSVTCVLSGLAPALQVTKRDAAGALKAGSALPGARFTLRTLLLSVQVAAVVVLLVAAGVMVRSAGLAADRALGGEARGLSVVTIQAPVRGYDAARTRATSMSLMEQLALAAPQGTLALTSTPPLGSGNIKGGFRLTAGGEDQFNAIFEVSPSYFTLMGLAIRDGRGFEPGDVGRPVIVVNEMMAKQFWPGKSPVGQRILCTPPESGWNMPGELEIIGVVQDSLLTSLEEVQPTIFQTPTHRALPHALVNGPAAADAVVAAIGRVDPDLRVRVQSIEAALEPRLRSARVGAMIAGALGAMALGFACVGMFGVFAFWVRQRTQEIGVRMALGAQSSDVIRLVLGTTARAVAIGLAAGLLGSIAGARLLRSFLFGLSGIDPVTYVFVAAVLVTASLLAAFLPARRATRIDPLVALRYE
jgi:predicted permease